LQAGLYVRDRPLARRRNRGVSKSAARVRLRPSGRPSTRCAGSQNITSSP